jgi:hypothetical protein
MNATNVRALIAAAVILSLPAGVMARATAPGPSGGHSPSSPSSPSPSSGKAPAAPSAPAPAPAAAVSAPAAPSHVSPVASVAPTATATTTAPSGGWCRLRLSGDFCLIH